MAQVQQEVPAKPSGTKAIERAVAVLSCFERSRDLGIREIAKETGLTVGTTHRIVRALRHGGLLGQDRATGTYHLGYGVALLGRVAFDRLGFTAARPVLSKLAEDTGEAVNLGVRLGDESLIVTHMPSAQSLQISDPPGTRNPIHACSMGKVFLAFGGPLEGDDETLAAITPQTITARAELEDDLARIRARGYAISDEERSVGVRAIGAPVFDNRGELVAAVAMQAPVIRLSDELIPERADQVMNAAAHLRGLLTHMTDPRGR